MVCSEVVVQERPSIAQALARLCKSAPGLNCTMGPLFMRQRAMVSGGYAEARGVVFPSMP